jgi:adenylate cyclase
VATDHVDRRLVAILAADMVGYSRLMEADETGTIERQKAHRTELVDPKIDAHGGRIVKTTGDGMLVEFGSVVDATECAVAIQRAMAEREAEVGEERRIQYRVGINLGDIVIDGDDILGDGVNVAARLEGLAEPGGVCISDVVHQSVVGKLDLAFEDLGEQQVKNITKPVHAYRVVVDRMPTSPSTAPLPLPDKPSIAVLPFDNLSDDPQQEYFSDGMAEDLITDISKISGLFVIARNSSFAFKGKAVDVKEVAAKLGVRHILEGSVRKMRAKLRVNVQLIDAVSGGHIWAERYDGDMAEIFEFQDNIREQIVSALQVSLTPTDKVLTERKPTDSVEAYDLFLRGRANYYHYTREHMLEAIKCFEKAIEIDPNFAAAYGYLSYCHYYGWAQLFPGFDDTLDRAHELAERGVALDGTSAIALTRLGWIQLFMRRYDQAVANLEEAIAVAPNNAEVHANFGQVLNYWGNPERALEMAEKAFSIDTFVPPIWEMFVGLSHLLLRQYDEAVSRFLKTIEQTPKFTPVYVFLAWAYVELDRLDDANDAIKTVLEIIPQYTVKEVARIYAFRVDEVRNRILDNLRKAGLPEG